MEAEGNPVSGTCAIHPEEAATGHCAHCGTFGCESCLGWLGARLVCRTCVEEGRVTAHAGVPWERRSEIGWLRAVAASARELALRPTAFFANMNPDGGLGEALAFATLAPAVPMLGWCTVAGIGAAVGLALGQIGGSEAGILLGVLLLLVLFVPVGVVVGQLVWGLAQHAALRLLGVPAGTLAATLRVSLYSAGVWFWVIVPCVYYIAGLTALVVAILGYRQVHGISGARATAAGLLPAVLCGGAYGVVLLAALLAEGRF